MENEQTILQLLAANSKKISISIEITPPPRGQSIDVVFKTIDSIKQINPLWVDITSHGSTIEWLPQEQQGTYTKNKCKKSPGTIAICAAIKYKYDFVTVPHLLCHGFYKMETEDALIDLNYLGITNVLAIQGDGSHESNATSIHGHNEYANDLVQQIMDLNQGKYLGQQGSPSNFTVGIACYPEKHIADPNMSYSQAIFRQKIESGASYCVSQMFYDTQKFLDFYDANKQYNVPIIPGMKILTNKKQLSTIPKFFNIDIPQALVESMLQAQTQSEQVDAGVEFTYQQCKHLIENGHNHLHFYIMHNTAPFIKVMEKLHNDYNIEFL